MNIFAIGDLHLSFSVGEIKTMDIFGASWLNHEKRLEEAWRKVVEPEDIVLLPGDLSWALKFDEIWPDIKWLASLPGKKIISKGNHDLWWGSMKKMKNFDESISVLYNNSYVYPQFAVCGTRGWICPEDSDFKEASDRKVYERELLRLRLSLDSAKPEMDEYRNNNPDYRLIAALHFPPSAFADAKSAFCDIIKEYGVTDVVYGHLHGINGFDKGPKGIIDGVSYNLVSLDYLNCAPKLIAKV